MSGPTNIFELISERKRTAGAAAAVVLAAASFGTFVSYRSDAALEGVARQIRTARLDDIPDNRILSGTGSFTNTLTGTPGRFELLGREHAANGQTCYRVAITDGGLSGAGRIITDKDGRQHKQAMAATVCLS